MGSFLVFIFKVVETVLQAAFRRPPTPTLQRLTPRERVIELERIRQRRGYKPGWLFYRCEELGLEDTLRDLRDEGLVP
jgi:hypothetical protein